MEKGTKFILGVFGDDHHALEGAKALRKADVKIHEVYSPFPIHGIDDVLGYKRSRLPKAAFMFGALGTTLALTMQFLMLGVDWPMIIGGKNHASLPPFIPITFELTVLLAALGMVGTFMVASNLKPYSRPRIFDVRITDDKHVIAIDMTKNKLSAEAIKKIFAQTHVEEVNERVFD